MRVATVSLADLRAAGHLRAAVGECAALVTLLDGEVHAVSDLCHHRRTSLSGGLVRDGVVTCPGHLWQYDVRTGARHDTRAEGLATYPTRIVEDQVEITLPDAVPEPTLREILLAHASASRDDL